LPPDQLAVPWYLYAGFIAFVVAMLLVDLKLFHTEAREPTTKESGAWVAVWVTLALLFGVGVFVWKGVVSGLQYFQGYLIEYSLSIDNIFVFIIIFAYFGIPRPYQHQVLFYGILGAIIFRGIFIAIGVSLTTRFDWVLYIFGVILIVTAVRVALGTHEVQPEQNAVLRLFRRRFKTTMNFHGNRLFALESGRRVATPLFVALLVIETTDIVFAIDSIPAIFAITNDPFIILTSNVFAVLGLRALYFLLAGTLNRLHLLQYGLAIVLAFVGVKLLTERFIHIEQWQSLTFIILVLGGTAVASLLLPPREPPVKPPVVPPAEERP
jgi:tellurite resistance protein TerC